MTDFARDPFVIAGSTIDAGTSGTTELPVARLVTGNRVSIPLRIAHGRQPGPTVWLSAAVHGDEISGVEIIRRVLSTIDATTLAGTIVAVPIVNVHGFMNGDRYLPDRRDLNRSFPGSPNGSLAARIANLFLTEIVDRCDVGIDLHTGSDHRANWPQIRADLDDPPTRELAFAFGAPFMLHAKLRDGSLRASATERGATVLLYEGGEAWRFDRDAIETGANGVLRALNSLGMTANELVPAGAVPIESRSSSWVRTRKTGIVLPDTGLGDHVERGTTLAVVHDAVGERLATIKAPHDGVVIGITHQPLVNQGDAIAHIARLDETTPGRSTKKDFT